MPKTLLGAGVLTIMVPTIMVLSTPAAFAQSEPSNRYTMAPTENGFVRLDTVTGAMSLCSRGRHGWQCRVMGSNEDAQQHREIEALKSENAELRSELLRLERRLSELARRDASPQNVPEFELPKEEDVDKAVDYLEGMIRKFRERFENFGDKTRPDSAPSAGNGSSSDPGSGPGSSPNRSGSPDQLPQGTPDQKQDEAPASPSPPNSAPPANTPDAPDNTPL